jgi:hypothetical protein
MHSQAKMHHHMTFLAKQCYEKIVLSLIGKRNKREVSSVGCKIISKTMVVRTVLYTSG